MTLIEVLIFLVIAGICGVIAEWIVGFSPGGFLTSIMVGLVGAYIGSWLAQQLGFPPILQTSSIIPQTADQQIIVTNFSFDIVWSILGSIVLLLAIMAVRGFGRGGRRRRRRRST